MNEETLKKLRVKVEDAKVKERWLNAHIGHRSAHLVVQIRWDELEELLNLVDQRLVSE
jgi:hypothetical protein